MLPIAARQSRIALRAGGNTTDRQTDAALSICLHEKDLFLELKRTVLGEKGGCISCSNKTVGQRCVGEFSSAVLCRAATREEFSVPRVIASF